MYERREFLEGISIAPDVLPHGCSFKIIENHSQRVFFFSLSALFLDLSHGENHIDRSSFDSETTLAKERDSTVVSTDASISFLEDVDDIRSFHI